MTPAPSVNNSRGGSVNPSTPAQNAGVFNATQAATPQTLFSGSLAGTSYSSSNTGLVAESPDSFTTNYPGQTLQNSTNDNAPENFINDQASQLVNHSCANPSVASTPAPVDNSYGQVSDNNQTLEQALLAAFENSPELPSGSNTTPAVESPSSFGTPPADILQSSPDVSLVDESPNTSFDSTTEDFSSGSVSGNALNSFDASPAQEFPVDFGVDVGDNNNFGDNNFDDLSGSFAPAIENQQNFVDLTDESNVLGQGVQAANYGQVDQFVSFASQAQNAQQQDFNVAPQSLFDGQQHQAFNNAPGDQSVQQYDSSQLDSNPSPVEQAPTPAAKKSPKKSTKKKAALPKKPAAKRPSAKKAKKDKKKADDVEEEHFWGLGLEANEFEFDNEMATSLRTFSDSVPQMGGSTMNGALPAPADNGTALYEYFMAPAQSFENGPLVAPHPDNTYIDPANTGIQNDAIVQQVSIAPSHVLSRLTNTDQNPQLTIDTNLQPPAKNPPNKRKRGNTAATSAVQEDVQGTAPAPAPKRRRVTKPRANAKGSLSKSASSAKFGLGKGAGTGLNSPRTMYVFDDKSWYLIPANIMDEFIEFCSTPIERAIEEQPASEQLAIEQPQPPVQQQDFVQQQPVVQPQEVFQQQDFAQQQEVFQQQNFAQQQSFDQQSLEQQPSAPAAQNPYEGMDEDDIELFAMIDRELQEDAANDQNMWNDNELAHSSPRQPLPLSQACIDFGITDPRALHAPVVSTPPVVQEQPQTSSSPEARPEWGPGSDYPFSRKPEPFGFDLDENGAVIQDPVPERTSRSVPTNREVIEKFNLRPLGTGTERDVSHLNYFIDLAHRTGLLTCGEVQEIPGAFRWESWKTCEENLLNLRPFLGTYSTRDWFEQWTKGENPVQVAEKEAGEL